MLKDSSLSAMLNEIGHFNEYFLVTFGETTQARERRETLIFCKCEDG